jgi:hypothetical protein
MRTTVEESFSSDAITVTTTPGAVSLGDITDPRQILFKLVSGNDLLISVNAGSTYPLSLNGANDALLLNLESREISTITCVADTSRSLSGLYFDLADVAAPVRVWFNMAAEAATGSITYGTAAEAVAATGTLTLAANPTPGDTVTVGTKTYTFRTASASFVCKATADIGQGEYFDITFGGSTKRFWYDIDAAGTGAPADPGGGLNEIDIVTGNTDSQVATATELVVEAVTNLTSSASTNTVTVVYDLPGTLVVADSGGDVLGTITAIALVANEVLVGAAATDSIDNLISAITDGAGIGTGEGTLYGTGTTANATATAAAGSGDTMTVTAITAGYNIEIVTIETLTDGGSGFAAANLTGGLNRTAVIVNGTTFGYKATAPGANQFSSIAELNTLVTGRPLISSTSNGTVISIVADTPGVAGNAITLVREANTAGSLSVSGAGALTGGLDASTAPAEPTGGRLLPVVIVKNSANTVVATAILNAINTDAAFLATLATATLTITDAAPGARTAIAAGTSTFTGAARSGSTAAPVVWMKSFGTSQVVVAVAPN